jgi:hypothetical protein
MQELFAAKLNFLSRARMNVRRSSYDTAQRASCASPQQRAPALLLIKMPGGPILADSKRSRLAGQPELNR